MDKLRAELIKEAYTRFLAFKSFSELWQVYKGIEKAIDRGYPVIVRNHVIKNEEELAVFLEVLYSMLSKEIEKRSQQNNTNNEIDSSEPDANFDFL
ncbi:hypothetical protein [Persephonella sp.]